ncbi:geranylgeranylglyceryl/heptaprenylglyceryl phosphate synthase [Algoriphagus faecimaris]|nr:geranylgeranylglyceryl/heptaprenylglyceryl phosphate synthase [Algoriphagus faecimaris]
MKKMPSKVSKALNKLVKTQKKGIAWLIDPDKINSDNWNKIAELGNHKNLPDFIFLGGSTYTGIDLNPLVHKIKTLCPTVPIVLFPGSRFQLADEADALLFMSLISGRNPEFLIEQQVEVAERISQSSLEILPTGYLLVNDGEILSVHQQSQTLPLLNTEKQKILQTALAGKLLGMRYIFIDAGSGASSPVSSEIIELVKKRMDQTPLLIGGGLDSLEKIDKTFSAGADLAIIGNAAEKNPDFLVEAIAFKNWLNQRLFIN